ADRFYCKPYLQAHVKTRRKDSCIQFGQVLIPAAFPNAFDLPSAYQVPSESYSPALSR
ncbi:hypothetical protein FRC14_000394, partial [Serendipita sp. 396]